MTSRKASTTQPSDLLAQVQALLAASGLQSEVTVAGRPGRSDVTALQVQNAKPGTTLVIGDGLRLVVGKTGKRKWVCRFVSPITKKTREMGLGSPDGKGAVTLAAAREKTKALRAAVKAGHDPLFDAVQMAEATRAEIAAREAAKAAEEARAKATLEFCADAYYRTIAEQFRSTKHALQWWASLTRNIPAALWRKPIADIRAPELLDLFAPMMARIPETASRVRQRLEKIFDDAVLHEHCQGNPAAALASKMRDLRKMQKTKQAVEGNDHLRALPFRRVPAFIAALRASDRVGLSVRLCMAFAVATAARSGEARGARWGEIDLETRTWNVPANRMKRGKPHAVPLSDFAVELLTEAAALRTDDTPSALCFPPPRLKDGALSDMSLTMALRRIPTGGTREDGTPECFIDLTTSHGLARTTFSTWANNARLVDSDVIETVLAHREEDRIKAAYDRSREEGDRFERDRRRVLDAWGRFITATAESNVVPFPGVATA